MGQIELWPVKFDVAAALRSARNVTSDVVIADHEPLDVHALDVFSVWREHERNFPVEPCGLHLNLAQPRDLLVREIEY